MDWLVIEAGQISPTETGLLIGFRAYGWRGSGQPLIELQFDAPYAFGMTANAKRQAFQSAGRAAAQDYAAAAGITLPPVNQWRVEFGLI